MNHCLTYFFFFFFFFNDTATTEIYTLSLHDALPIFLMLPHYGNWEWVIGLGKHLDYKGFGIYKTLKNKYFDKLFRDIRSRFNAELVNTHQTTGVIRENQSKGLYGV